MCARARFYVYFMRKVLSLRNKFYDVSIFCFKHLVSFCFSRSKYHAPMNMQFFLLYSKTKSLHRVSGTKPKMNQTYQVWLPITFFHKKHPSKMFSLLHTCALGWKIVCFYHTFFSTDFFFNIQKQNMVCILFTPPRNLGGVIFSLQFVCMCVCPTLFLWTKSQPNGCTDLDAVFVKWLLTTLAKTLLKLVTFGLRSWSLRLNIHFFFIILC